MISLNNLLKTYKGEKLLAIFAHPDDESFIAGSLFQEVKKYAIKTRLLCLTKGGKGKNSYGRGNLKNIRAEELRKSVEILGIDEYDLCDYQDADLLSSRSLWTEKIQYIIKVYKPSIIVTFDNSGITGHPDHIISCAEIYKLVKKSNKKPLLLWRVPNKREKILFKTNLALKFASTGDYFLRSGFKETITKIRSIYVHKSQMQNFRFKLRILNWFLINHKEQYYKVDYKREYKYKIVPYKIT